uniref:Uncharacterized protein n=1 Tax=Clastoptera arizonana TaxID=38151 RepID=A0A1B6CVZ9_9HEMI
MAFLPTSLMFLKYENLTAKDVPCYTYNIMIDIVLDAYKGSITRDKCEILMKRGMAPTKKENNTYHFARDPRLKIAGLATLTIDLVKQYAGQIKCQYLNIRASEGITFTYPELYNELLEIIKSNASRFEYEQVSGSHHVHLQNPEAVSDIIGIFLTTHNHHNTSNIDDLLV